MHSVIFIYYNILLTSRPSDEVRMYACRSYNSSNVKVIYVPSGLAGIPSGRMKFIMNRCPVDACTLTAKSRFERTADVRLLRGDAFFEVGYRKPRGQIWVLWLLESPVNTPKFSNAEGLINWTATYRSDSTIVTPYDKYVNFAGIRRRGTLQLTSGKWPHPPADQEPTKKPRRSANNYAAGKSRLVAWFVSKSRLVAWFWSKSRLVAWFLSKSRLVA